MKKPELNAAPPAEWTEQRIHRSAKQLFLYCFLAYGCSYIGRKNFAACLPAMLAEGLLTETVGGYITTAYMLLYGMGQLVSGLVAARVKPQYMIGTGLLGAAICNACMGLVTEPWLMPVIWAGNGLFHSMLWAPIIRVFTDRMPPDRRAWAGTNIVASCSIGAVLAFLIPSLVLRLSGWRVVFLVSGGILFFALLVWVVGHRFLRGYVRMMDEACRVEREALRMMADAKAAAEHRKVKRSLPAVILSSGLWFLLLCLFCNGALRDGVETWAPTFLSASFGLDSSAAALIAVVIPLVSVSGTYTAEWIHKRFIRNEVYLCCLMFGITSLCVVGLYLSRHVHPLLCAVFMAVGVAAMWGVNHMFLTIIPYHFAPLGLSASVTGFLNSVIYFSTALCSGLYGALAERLGWERLIFIWLGVGIVGAVFCVFGGLLWEKKRGALASGDI